MELESGPSGLRDGGGETFAEPVPLDWSIVRNGETRYQHVRQHNKSDAGKPEHGVFHDDPVKVTNEAWSIKHSCHIPPLNDGGCDIYVVPMGRNVGYAGGANATKLAGVEHRGVRIVVVRSGTVQIVTAYPVV